MSCHANDPIGEGSVLLPVVYRKCRGSFEGQMSDLGTSARDAISRRPPNPLFTFGRRNRDESPPGLVPPQHHNTRCISNDGLPLPPPMVMAPSHRRKTSIPVRAVRACRVSNLQVSVYPYRTIVRFGRSPFERDLPRTVFPERTFLRAGMHRAEARTALRAAKCGSNRSRCRRKCASRGRRSVS